MTNYRIFRLKSGARVGVAEMPWLESVSAGIWAGVGGRHDPAGLEGLAHFAEHMVFKGTARRTARRLNAEVESAGGSLDAYTSEDHTAFYVRGPAEHFPRFADVLFDLYRHSTFSAGDVKKEREVIAEELAMYREQPSQHVEDLLCRAAWPGHPLGHPIAGTEDSLKRINATALRRHAAQFYGAKNSVISVAGRVTAEEVREVLENVPAAPLPPGRAPRTKLWRSAARRRSPAVAAEARDIEQTQVALAFHTPGRHAPEAPALRLLSVLLGENTSSRLWVELRERRGLCYDAGSDLTTLRDTGLLHLYAGVDPDNLEKTLAVILRELRRLAEKPVSAATLRAAAEFSIGSGRLSLESNSSRMTHMAECLLLYGRMIPPEEIYACLRAVTPEDVRKLAADIFQPGNLTLALVGPGKENARLERLAVEGLR